MLKGAYGGGAVGSLLILYFCPDCNILATSLPSGTDFKISKVGILILCKVCFRVMQSFVFIIFYELQYCRLPNAMATVTWLQAMIPAEATISDSNEIKCEI